MNKKTIQNRRSVESRNSFIALKPVKPNISVFFPCYNDQHSIGELVENAFLVLKDITNKYEVIVVDDGSTDKSREILQRLAKKYKDLKLIFHAKNRGYGRALESGFRNASYDLIFYTDGDGQYDVGELPVLVALMRSDVDFVNGIKLARKDPTYRIVIGNAYSLFVRWFFVLPITDVDCDFRLIRKNIIDKIKLTSKHGAICVELVKKAQFLGARFREVSIHHYKRRWGESQFFRPKNIVFSLMELLVLWVKLMF